MPRRSSPRRLGSGRAVVLAVTFCSLLVPFATSRAVTFDNRPKILLHVKSTTSKNPCSYGSSGITNCSDNAQIITKGNLTPVGGPGYFYVYLLVAKGGQANIDGLQCGITYQNGQPGNDSDFSKIDIFGWSMCATLEFPTPGPNMWPRPGGGNLITWDAVNNCQTGDVAVAGYFYMACYGSSDVLSVIPRPVDGAAKIANCQNSETLLFGSDLGSASFSSGAVVAGCNPCSQNCGTPPTDVTPPAAVTSLEVTSVGITSVSLRWTAPGDDGVSGTANGFDMRLSTSPITSGNFDMATAATGEPVPGPAGTIQFMTVAGLTDDTPYYFALRTADESGNISGLSNVVPASTLPTWLVRVTPAPGNCPPAPGVCGSIPIGILRIGSQAVRAYSVSFQVNAPYVLCSPGITEGSYLSDAGATAFQTIDEGGGLYTVDATILGSPCGTLAGDGTLFNVNVQRIVGGALPVTITQVIARDCTNADIISSIGSYSVDVTPPSGFSNLTATRITTGNPPGERTGIRISYTGPDVASVEVYRAPFGGYPEYDESGGVAPNPQVTYPPGPPWTLTGVAQSGDVDSPPTRDFWYYAVYPRDSCGNIPMSVTRTAGTLNYHLGDVHDGVSMCQGDNAVDLSDVSFLGAHYGATLPHGDPLYCLDVGPTTDRTVNGRPATDHRLQFEDLVLFGLNFSVVSAPRLSPAGSEGLSDRLSLNVGDDDATGTRMVRVMMEGSGRVHGLSVVLDWNPAEATPIDFESGSLSASQGAPAMVLSGTPGSIDAVLMGAGSGLTGSGDLASIAFRVTPGTSPRFGIKSVEARDIGNHPVDVKVASNPEIPAPGFFPGRIDRVQPNPFSTRTDVVLILSAPSTVRLEVLDVRGRLVREIEGRIVPAGEASFSWDGRNDRGALEPSGFYVVRAEFPDHVETRSIRLVR